MKEHISPLFLPFKIDATADMKYVKQLSCLTLTLVIVVIDRVACHLACDLHMTTLQKEGLGTSVP